MTRLALLTVPALPNAARVVRATLTAALNETDRDRLDELLLAVTEAVTNATRHAYPGDGAGGDVDVHLDQDDGRVHVAIVDHGIGLDAPTGEAGAGLGLTLMRATSAACEHAATADGGTTVRLTFA